MNIESAKEAYHAKITTYAGSCQWSLFFFLYDYYDCHKQQIGIKSSDIVFAIGIILLFDC